jgi:hypothetical protein
MASNGGAMGANANSSGAIPSYSSMNKYTAYSPSGGNNSNNPYSAAPPPGAAVTSNSPVNSFSRPGAGYRGWDNGGGYGNGY